MKTTVEFDVHKRDMDTFVLITTVLKAYFKENKKIKEKQDRAIKGCGLIRPRKKVKVRPIKFQFRPKK